MRSTQYDRLSQQQLGFLLYEVILCLRVEWWVSVSVLIVSSILDLLTSRVAATN